MSTRLFLRLCVHRDSDGLLFLFVYHKRAYCISHCLVGEVLALEAQTLTGVIFTCGEGQGAEERGRNPDERHCFGSVTKRSVQSKTRNGSGYYP